MKQTKIKKIVIELDGVDVELTLVQAKELLSALGELFNEKVVEKTKFVPYPEPYPVCPKPWIPWRPQQPWITWQTDIPMYKSTCGTSMELSNNSVRLSLTS